MAKQSTPRSSRTVAPSAQAAPVHAAPAADNTVSTSMDYAQHEAMYHRFTGLVKWGIIGSIVVVLFLFIAIHPMVPPPAS